MNQKAYLTLAAVALFLLVCPVLTSIRGFEIETFHSLHTILITAIVLKINGWKVELPKNRPGFMISVFFVLGALFMGRLLFVTFYAMTDIMRFTPLVPLEPGGVPVYENWGFWGTVKLLVMAPVTEEIIFRYGLLGALMRLTNKPLFSLILTTVIFAEGHLSTAPQSHMPALFSIGLMIGLTFLVLGLPWAIVLHSICNGLDILLERITGQPALMIPYCSLLIIGMCVFVTKLFRMRRVLFQRETT
jgi:membrane protease YdiL (CAAX protease family)